jgi:hypothetical protein
LSPLFKSYNSSWLSYVNVSDFVPTSSDKKTTAKSNSAVVVLFYDHF